jgi:hypothetical protein
MAQPSPLSALCTANEVAVVIAVSDRKAQVPFWGRALSRGTQDDKNFFEGFA